MEALPSTRRLPGRLLRERRAAEEGFGDDEAKKLREEKASNTHARLKRVLTIVRHGKLPAGELAAACDYSFNHWGYLSTYLKHGRVDIDNNAMENAIRPTAVGKKNWLFVGHPEAGKRAAILYSILISCQRLEVQPLEYLTALLKADLAKLIARRTLETHAIELDQVKGADLVPLTLCRQCAIYKRYAFSVALQNLVRGSREWPSKYTDPDYGERKSR